MKMKHYLSLLCEKVYADRLLSGVNQTRISQGELIPRIKSCWRVRTEELKYLTVVRKYRPSLLPARIRSFSWRPGEFLSDLQLHAGQLLVFRAGRATPARRAEKDWGGLASLQECCPRAPLCLMGPKKTTCHLFKLHHVCLLTPGLQTEAPCFTVELVMDKRRKMEIWWCWWTRAKCLFPLFPYSTKHQQDTLDIYICILQRFCCSKFLYFTSYFNHIAIPPKKRHAYFLAVLLAGSVVMAWSTTVASSDTVPLGHDRHLHRPDPHLWLPSSPVWRCHGLHPGGPHCILGGTTQHSLSNVTFISVFTRFVWVWSLLATLT